MKLDYKYFFFIAGAVLFASLAGAYIHTKWMMGMDKPA